jgi:uncharacterized membrane protein YidH (DUF202 family)
MNISLTSYGFVINLFPISQQMQDKSKGSMMKSVLIALTFCFLSYVTLTKLAINIFGEENIQQSIFENLKNDQTNPLSIGIRVLFLVIFLCNIPYLFFPGKLSILNAYQEYKQRCFSRVIEKKMRKGDLEAAEEEECIDVVGLCDNSTYYFVCFGFLSAIIISAILINDLTIVFGMIAACSESLLNFVFPGLFFLMGNK